MNGNYKPISEVSSMFGMSQVWLHQLRIEGRIATKVIKDVTGKQKILYCVDDVECWIEFHSEEYESRKDREI